MAPLHGQGKPGGSGLFGRHIRGEFQRQAFSIRNARTIWPAKLPPFSGRKNAGAQQKKDKNKRMHIGYIIQRALCALLANAEAGHFRCVPNQQHAVVNGGHIPRLPADG